MCIRDSLTGKAAVFSTNRSLLKPERNSVSQPHEPTRAAELSNSNFSNSSKPLLHRISFEPSFETPPPGPRGLSCPFAHELTDAATPAKDLHFTAAFTARSRDKKSASFHIQSTREKPISTGSLPPGAAAAAAPAAAAAAAAAAPALLPRAPPPGLGDQRLFRPFPHRSESFTDGLKSQLIHVPHTEDFPMFWTNGRLLEACRERRTANRSLLFHSPGEKKFM